MGDENYFRDLIAQNETTIQELRSRIAQLESELQNSNLTAEQKADLEQRIFGVKCQVQDAYMAKDAAERDLDRVLRDGNKEN